MDLSERNGATRIVVLSRAIFSLLILFSAEMVLLYHVQPGSDIRLLPCLLTVFPDAINPINNNLACYLIDIAFSLAEAAGFIHEAITVKWPIQNTILLYESLFAVMTTLWIIIYVCMGVCYRLWSNADHRISPTEIQQASHFPGESTFMAVFRTQVTAALIFFILAFGLTGVVVDPLRESSLLSVKETHSPVFPANLWLESCKHPSQYSCKPPTFLNVLVARPGIAGLEDDKNILFPGVSVTTFGDESSSSASSCNLVRQATRQIQGDQVEGNMTWNVWPFGCTYEGIPPQILITVNFTQLNVNSNSTLGFPFVYVMVGNSDDTDKIIRMTKTPVVIIPGENIVGIAKQHVLQYLKHPVLATLGINNVYDHVVMSEVVHLRNDPQVDNSPLISSSSDTSTIRIIPFINIGDWKVIQEYRDKTFLKGLSSLGGLWSLFSSFFALFFGISIMTSLFRTKPLSIFGIVHLIEPSFLERNSWGNKYQIGTEKPRNVQDFAAFMIDHVVDVDFVFKQAANQPAGIGEEIVRDEENHLLRTIDVPLSELSLNLPANSEAGQSAST